MFRRLITAATLALALGAAPAADAAGKPKVHVVYKGQRLGSIAKRYRVSIAAICNANGIDRSDPIHPGQKLLIPARDDEDGSEAKKHAEKKRDRKDSSRSKSSRKSRKAGRSKSSASKDRKSQPDAPDTVRDLKQHKVYRGQRLASIAKRYRVSIEALCHANDIGKSDPIYPGQILYVPDRDDRDGSLARVAVMRHKRKLSEREMADSARASRKASSKRKTPAARKRRKENSWEPYSKPPKYRGYIKLVGFNEQWRGYVIGPGNRVLGGAHRAVTRVLSGEDLKHGIDKRLVRLIAKVSDQFGGRPMRIVSGHRSTSYSSASRHKVGKAVDFSIPGVPNSVLRDYLLTLGDVGVGYYPNSTFVHLDVRETKTYWVDYSGPGEPPQYRR